MNRKKKKHVKHGIRMFFAFIIFSFIIAGLGYNLFNNILMIRDMNSQKLELRNKIVDLGKEKEVLENDILKLENSDYIARYVREKYFYSKDGELILRIDD